MSHKKVQVVFRASREHSRRTPSAHCSICEKLCQITEDPRISEDPRSINNAIAGGDVEHLLDLGHVWVLITRSQPGFSEHL